MPKVIDRVAVIFHYVDGRTEEGYLPCPLSRHGQYEMNHVILSKEDDVEVFINMTHVINAEQKILYREFDAQTYSEKNKRDFSTKRTFIDG